MNMIMKFITFVCKLCLYVTPFDSVIPFYENRFRKAFCYLTLKEKKSEEFTCDFWVRTNIDLLVQMMV